jgi:hypothetical protein
MVAVRIESIVANVNELLAYFRQAIEHPESVQPWNDWWLTNSDKVESAFSREDFLRLKHRKLRGARIILENSGWTPANARSLRPINTGYCDVCGERLFRMLPGTSKSDIVQFGKRAGLDGFGLHHGLYCPNHCTWLLVELRRNDSETNALHEAIDSNNPMDRSGGSAAS